MFETIRLRSLVELPADVAGRSQTIIPGGSYELTPMRELDTEFLDPDQVSFLDNCRARDVVHFPPLQLRVLSDALVAGQGAVAAANRYLVGETVLEFLAQRQMPDGLAVGAFGDHYRIRGEISRRVAGPAILLQRPWFKNYGHWLVDAAALLAISSRMALPPDCRVVIGRQPDPRMREIVRETVAMLAPGAKILERPEHEVWEFETLYLPSPAHIPPFYNSPEALACLRYGLSPRSPAPVRDRRLFLARRGGSRRLVNEDEVVSLLGDRGFEIVVPEELGVAAQANLMRAARIVVGVKGAALTNLVFATAGADVVVLSPSDFPDPFFWDLASRSGVAYSEIFGPTIGRNAAPAQNDFRIDPARLGALLDRLDLPPNPAR